MSARRERMSPVDTAWLRMDPDHHLMAIKGLLVVAGSLEGAALHAVLQTRLVQRFPRFTHRVVQDDTAAWWEPDPRFDLKHHLRSRRLPRGDEEAALQRLVSDLAAEPLDPRRPLWTVDVVRGMARGTALIVRVHHCVADGLALMGVLLSLTGHTPAQSLMAGGQGTAGRAAVPDDELSLRCPWDNLLDPLTRAGTDSVDMGAQLWTRYAQLVQDPQQAELMRQLAPQALAALLQLALWPEEGSAAFKRPRRGRKRIAWAPALALSEVQAVASHQRCSIHEVALACVAGALRRHLIQRGESVEGVRIRVLVPINLRRRLHLPQLGNRFGLVPLMLPVHLAHPPARLRAVARLMRPLRRSLLPPLSLGLLGAIGLAPRAVQLQAAQLLAHKASGVVTQVPGPREPVYLAGHEVERIMFWVPQSGDLGLGVSLSTYGGQLQMGLIVDEQIVPDPQTVAHLFVEEFNQLLLGLLMGLDRA